jgi:anaerobic magnesium-protoporphyrin IX monomethyl ester cyclase
MKITLIDPPHEAFLGYYRFYFPLGLVSVGSALEARGHDVTIIDADHLPEGRCLSQAAASKEFDGYYAALEDAGHPAWSCIATALAHQQPDVVGISVLSCKLPSALLVARLARQIVPRARIIVGGDHTVYFAKELAAEPAIDAVVIGEGEDTACELLEAWASGRDIRYVRGIAFRDGAAVIRTPRRKLIDDLDRLPLPNRSLLENVASYRPEDMGLIMTSRGCPYHCTFCGIAASLGRSARFRSIGNCIEEIAATHRNYGTDYFSFRDGTFTLDRQRTVDFCHALAESGLGVSWECLTRPDCLDDELIGIMMAANCVQVRLGLESGSQRVLKYMRKDITVSEYQRAADLLERHGLFWSAYLMFGVPEDTVEDIQATLELAERLQPSFITVARYVPLPGTPMYKDVQRQTGTVDWKCQNNKALGPSYSRHIPTRDFQRLMERIGSFAESYNRRHAEGARQTDRRLKSGFEDQALRLDVSVLESS